MKSKVTYTFFVLVALAVLTMSNSAGRAGSQNSGGTTAPGDGQFCSNCHSGGNFGAGVNLKLYEKGTNTEVTQYVPGTTYDVEIIISSTTTPGGYGFQALALKDADNTAINTWANNATANTQFSTIASTGRQYFEQSTTLNTNTFQAEWTAPASGSGNITFYLSGNAVNNSGSTAGDQAVSNSAVFTENTVSTSGLENLGISLDIFPNPTVENLTLMLNSDETKDLTINIYNQNGQNVLSENVTVQNGENRFNFEVANYATGVYFVEITDGQFRTAKRFLVGR
jgi:hypothetical protein